MTRVYTFLCLAVVVATGCTVTPREPSGTASESEEQRVLAAEDAYVAAEVARDEAALRRLVDDAFANNSATGTTAGKEELIRNVLNLNMTDQTISERSVMIQGDIAIIFGTSELHFQDPGEAERISRLRYTSVYVKRGEDWRMLALQMQPRAPL